jgi:hypothetical protein
MDDWGLAGAALPGTSEFVVAGLRRTDGEPFGFVVPGSCQLLPPPLRLLRQAIPTSPVVFLSNTIWSFGRCSASARQVTPNQQVANAVKQNNGPGSLLGNENDRIFNFFPPPFWRATSLTNPPEGAIGNPLGGRWEARAVWFGPKGSKTEKHAKRRLGSVKKVQNEIPFSLPPRVDP